MRKAIWFFLLLLMASGTAAQDASESFSIITADNAQNLQKIRSWSNMIGRVGFSPDNSTMVIWNEAGYLEFISTETLETVRLIEDLDITVGWNDWLSYSLDGTELLIDNTESYTLLDLETGEIIASHANTDAYWFAHSPDFRRFLQISFGEDYVSVHDTLTSEELLRVEDVADYELSPDGNRLLTFTHEPRVQIWDMESQTVIYEILPPSETIIWDGWNGAGFSPDGLVWVNWIEHDEAGNTKASTIQFWDISRNTVVFELEGNFSYDSMIFENDYVIAWGMYAGFSRLCTLWNFVEKVELPCPAGGNSWATISPNGEVMAVNSGTSYDVYIHAVENMRETHFSLDTEPTWFVAFSPDSRLLVTIDLEIHLWAVPSEE